ncbi:undecaprenyl-diphosphatase [Halogranum gelatinilyticum]|uniref:Undecaprenyl-diphosphatase n=1 Tax=Halogranum gelatinilyticum TaxID=660521 RepID=A0A1G9XI98_9EURY|nr:undecaprenyl-diphosphate phosphatase [Halogranum gelatinilyticum]SDM96474.1 undecaprenyl-diphosphatase [Halogranum gelatinilyticum]
MDRALVIAVVVGLLQGVFEWLPISSEGNIAIALTALGSDPSTAVAYALFLHAGTALSATVYYRDELLGVARRLPSWRPGTAFDGETATLSFLALGTLASGVVAIVAYSALDRFVSELTGGAFVALVGGLLVLTGLLQRFAGSLSLGGRENPDLVDAVVVGTLQGLAVLPGVSRSGTTASALLLRGHDGPDSFRLSFLLSIPAALGGGVLAVADLGGLPGVTPAAALVSLSVAALVGYLTIGALMKLVRRVPFWGVCVGLGGLAVAGGVGLLFV